MNSRFSKLGWVVAAATIGILSAVGFQDSTTKIGVVDITKVVESSDFGKTNQDTFKAMKDAREGVLAFIDQYRVLSVDQATKIKNLSIKDTPLTAGEKAELDKAKADVIAAADKNRALGLKQPLTEEERKLLEEFARNAANMENTANQWLRQFTVELENWVNSRKLESLNRARAAVTEVAKAQGYSVVFESGIAPYGANDLSDAALKAMNAKK